MMDDFDDYVCMIKPRCLYIFLFLTEICALLCIGLLATCYPKSHFCRSHAACTSNHTMLENFIGGICQRNTSTQILSVYKGGPADDPVPRCC